MTETESERWFDEYLLTHGYTWKVEPPDLGVPTRPDRLIDRAGVEAICEVKEFTTDAMQRRWPEGGSQIGSFSSDEWLRNVRRAITEKAEQLEPLAGDPRPLVIVLANLHGVLAEIAGDKLIEAMYGDLGVTFRLDPETGGPAEEPHWTLGEGGRLADGKAPWVSAVAGLRRGDRRQEWELDWLQRWREENWPREAITTEEAIERSVAANTALRDALKTEDPPEGHYFYLHVVEAASEDVVPLPDNIFDGERDRRWVFNREVGSIEPPQDEQASA